MTFKVGIVNKATCKKPSEIEFNNVLSLFNWKKATWDKCFEWGYQSVFNLPGGVSTPGIH